MIKMTIEENGKEYAPAIQKKFEDLVIKFTQDVKKRECPVLKKERTVDLALGCDRALIRVFAKRELRKEGLI